MPLIKSLLTLAGLAGLMLIADLATSAHATIVSIGPGSPTTISGVAGIASLTFSPTPATEILVLTGSDLPGNQSPSTIAASISTVFSVPTPSLTADIENLTTNPFTESVPSGFDYAAIHQDHGEIIFFYSTLQTSFTLEAFTDSNEMTPSGALSNARFYSRVPAPSIGHGLPVLLAVGGLLFGAKLWERSKKHRLLGAAVPHPAA
jgi:hypothetical protein